MIRRVLVSRTVIPNRSPTFATFCILKSLRVLFRIYGERFLHESFDFARFRARCLELILHIRTGAFPKREPRFRRSEAVRFFNRSLLRVPISQTATFSVGPRERVSRYEKWHQHGDTLQRGEAPTEHSGNVLTRIAVPRSRKPNAIRWRRGPIIVATARSSELARPLAPPVRLAARRN